MVNIDIEGTTDTKSGWTQIQTGYYQMVTGVYSNTRYQPIPKGLTIFERLEKHFGPDDIVTVAVIGKKGHVGASGPQKLLYERVIKRTHGKQIIRSGKIIEENGRKYVQLPGKPYYNAKDCLDVWNNGLVLDEKVGTRAIELLEKYKDKPSFFFVHFADVDHAGHKHGENSTEYNDALISAMH